jgi:hypothetical protein
MFFTILSNSPLYVFPLAVFLAFLGYRSSKDRVIPVLLVYAISLLGLLTLNTAMHLPHASTAVNWLLSTYVIGAFIGHYIQQIFILSRGPKHVALRGEWVTMITIMGLFLGNFATGFMSAATPDIVSTLEFSMIYGAIAGLFSGSLTGRAVRVALTKASQEKPTLS